MHAWPIDRAIDMLDIILLLFIDCMPPPLAALLLQVGRFLGVKYCTADWDLDHGGKRERDIMVAWTGDMLLQKCVRGPETLLHLRYRYPIHYVYMYC